MKKFQINTNQFNSGQGDIPNVLSTNNVPSNLSINSNPIKSINLPDGSTIMKINMTSIQIKGPSGKIITISPIIPYFPKEDNSKKEYINKKCYVEKLGYGKLLGKNIWKKRWLVLNNSELKYYTDEEEKNLKGTIRLLYGTWCKSVDKNSPKQKDAHRKIPKFFEDPGYMFSMMNKPIGNIMSDVEGTVGKNCAFAVHKPVELSSLLNTITTNSILSIGRKIEKDTKRTWYFVANDDKSRDEWVEAINNNIICYQNSEEAFQFVKNSYLNFMKQVGSMNAENFNWKEIFEMLYTENS